ncbi:MAG: hypothetical protein MJE68_22605 [Proteobacteria bacterium]|nr:hypothetical protein [Pseudomonadota bacterium]
MQRAEGFVLKSMHIYVHKILTHNHNNIKFITVGSNGGMPQDDDSSIPIGMYMHVLV